MKLALYLSLILCSFSLFAMEKNFFSSRSQEQNPGRLHAILSAVHSHGVAAFEYARYVSAHTPAPSGAVMEEVQVSDELSVEELSALITRKEKIQRAFSSLFTGGFDPADIPSVAICYSGGGMRAKLTSLAFAHALEKAHLLSCTEYISGVSGSAWFIQAWIASGLSLDAYKDQLLPRITQTVMETLKLMEPEDFKAMASLLVKKSSDITSIDLYSFFLAQLFLKGIVENPYTFGYSSVGCTLANGNYPLPLANIVSNLQGADRIQFEYSPFLFGSHEAHARGFIPLSSMGRPFEKGRSCTLSSHCELPLAYLLAAGSSAYAVDMSNLLHELYGKVAETLVPALKKVSPTTQGAIVAVSKQVISAVTSSAIQLLLSKTGLVHHGRSFADVIGQKLTSGHISPCQINNHLYKQKRTLIKNEPYLSLVDGCLQVIENNRMNLAIAPLLHRKTEVILICDTSESDRGSSLRAAQAYATVHRLPFPSIDYARVGSEHASLIVDHTNLEAPIIVYMPNLPNPRYNETFDPRTASFCKTFNFTYQLEESALLMGLVEHNVEENIGVIKKAFALAVERKRLKNRAQGQHDLLG
jgi:hypothetical protein